MMVELMVLHRPWEGVFYIAAVHIVVPLRGPLWWASTLVLWCSHCMSRIAVQADMWERHAMSLSTDHMGPCTNNQTRPVGGRPVCVRVYN